MTSQSAALRGLCPVCRLDVVLRQDGSLRRHGGGWGRRPCPGSHRMPLCLVV